MAHITFVLNGYVGKIQVKYEEDGIVQWLRPHQIRDINVNPSSMTSPSTTKTKEMTCNSASANILMAIGLSEMVRCKLNLLPAINDQLSSAANSNGASKHYTRMFD